MLLNSLSFFNLVEDFAALEISGDKAAEFLQGQFTCDIRKLQSEQALFGACCDHKGRVLANGWLGKWQNVYLLFLPKSMLTITLEHLNKFAMFSRVSLIARPDWIVINYLSADNLPESLTQYMHSHLVINADGVKQFLHWIMTPQSDIKLIEQHLGAITKNSNDLKFLWVLANLVFIEPATQGLFLPQMLALEKLDGISFSKGCYIGQEVIARTQHLGQLKRHLQTLVAESSAEPSIGEELIDDNQETIGHIVAAAKDPEDGYRLLAVLQDRAISSNIYLRACSKAPSLAIIR